MMKYFTLNDVDVRNKRVLVRMDLDVPLSNKRNKHIIDDSRLRASLPTLKYLLQQNATIIIIGYLGRPNGKRVESLSLKPTAHALEKLLKHRVTFLPACRGEIVHNTLLHCPQKNIVMLENIRFYPEEEKNNKKFAKELSSIADVFVNDSFATMHRPYAGIVGVTTFIPSCAGFAANKEIHALTSVLHPKRPLVVLMGGAKVSDKIATLRHLCKKADIVLICGAMMFAFLKAQGHETGTSLLDEKGVILARALIKQKNIILQTDVVIAKTITNTPHIISTTKIPQFMSGFDIGPETIAEYCKILKKARTIFWNGPAGLAEVPAFAKGTNSLARAIAQNHGTTIIGGGDTHAAIKKLHLQSKYTHVSTGGGASLAFLNGEILPGIQALIENRKKYRKKF